MTTKSTTNNGTTTTTTTTPQQPQQQQQQQRTPSSSSTLPYIPLTPMEIIRMYEAGMLVGLANAAVFHPIDTLRIRTFFKRTEHTKTLGTLSSFLNGLGFNLVSTAIKQMAAFPTQDVVKQHFVKSGYDKSKSQFYSSIVSGFGLGLVATPISAIKVPLQASAQDKYTVLTVVRDLYTKHGLAGFFRGGAGNVMRDMSWCMVYFPLYAYFREAVDTYEENVNDAISTSTSTPSTSTPSTPPASTPSTATSRSTSRNPTDNHNDDPHIVDHHPTVRKVSTNFLNSVASVAASSCAMLVSYPFDGARLYRQTHPSKGDFNFWFGFLESLKPTRGNLQSFASGLIRVPLSTAFCHTLYLYLSSPQEGSHKKM
eukprot:TRINITY_DN2116_c0_g1_i1.p2 TRINITY_DN2116_c0_g1~~TRINITY_DN2116_c0_g1_i1.p2  ORF type:complete len:369 (+),score=98.18 TRINITY_DN2116_c0_g1_i1:1690-2796(+)